jgi:adenylate cyclase
MIKKGKHLSIKALSASLTIVILMTGLVYSPIGKILEQLYLDNLFYLRGVEQQSNDVLVVGIDETSFSELNLRWPWPRNLHATLVNNLFDKGAKAVAFDILFPEPAYSKQEDEAFSAAINTHKNTFLAMDINVINEKSYVQKTYVKPADSLKVSDNQLGNLNIASDSDGVIRRIDFFAEETSLLSLAAAEKHNKNCCYPPGNGSSAIINYLGPARTIKTISYYQALEPDKYFKENIFKDKIIFVGLQTQSSVNPMKETPDVFRVPFSHYGDTFMPGVEIHATSAHNLINNSFINDTAGSLLSIFALVLSIIAIPFFLTLSPLIGLSIISAIWLSTSGISIYAFLNTQTYIPIMLFLLPLTAAYLISPAIQFYKSNKEKRFIQDAFGTYLSPNVVSELIENPDQLSLGGKDVEGSILFLDIAGFTTISEKFDAPTLVKIMNNCLDAITEIIIQHDGMIDKFIGDAVMAVWGAPVEQKDHAEQACHAAIAIQRMLIGLAKEEEQRTGAVLSARIGVNSGSFVAGNVGGSQRFDYTVLGNEVNTAARLEGVNKFYGTKIMIGENTRKLIDNGNEFRSVDRVRLKGKAIAIEIFEPLDAENLDAAQQSKCNELFTKGREHYESRQWDEAIEFFKQGLSCIETDGPCKTFITRCLENKLKPPSADWDGAYDMTSK